MLTKAAVHSSAQFFTSNIITVAVVSLGGKITGTNLIKHNILFTAKRQTGSWKIPIGSKQQSCKAFHFTPAPTEWESLLERATSKVSIDEMFPFPFAFPFHLLLPWTLIDCRSRLGPLSSSVLRLLPALPVVVHSRWTTRIQEYATQCLLFSNFLMCSYHHWL